MSFRVTLRQIKERVEDYMVKAVEEGEPCVVRRNGKDYAVILSHAEWERWWLGRQLDALGEKYRVSPAQQERAEELCEEQGRRVLSPDERRELRQLLKEFDKIMLRRAKALERLK